MTARAAVFGALAIGVSTLLATGARPGADPAVEYTPRERKRILAHAPLGPRPADETNAVADDPAAARLGQFLFFDTRLSGNGEVSCATCHDPEQSFADGRQLARGIGDLTRHTPALWNVAYNRWFFWDGRADTLWAQALVPLEVPDEHGTTRLHCAHVVHGDRAVRTAYERVFGPMPDLDDAARFPADARPVPDEPGHPHHRAWMAMAPDDRAAVDRVFANLGKAIAAYERRLVSDRAPFDTFVEGLRDGDPERMAAITPAAQRGLKLFAGRANCELCHFGPNFSDGEFHSTGIGPLGGGPLHDAARYEGIEQLRANPFNATGPFADGRDGPAADKTRSLVRSTESWGQFKTPSLRNVALTAPYMHQGQLATLRDVIEHYSTLENAVLPGHHREQLLVPLNLTDEEIADLEAFLRSLTGGSPDPALLRQPASPLQP
jgi:cytochrome c peroxidase